MSTLYPCDSPLKIQCYLYDLEEVFEVVDIWLKSTPMTYPLHSALKSVWNIVNNELQAIRNHLLPSGLISTSALDMYSHSNYKERSYPDLNGTMDQDLQHVKNRNRKRGWTPHEDDRAIASIPRRSPRLSKSIKNPVGVTKVVFQSPLRIFKTKRHRTASPRDVSPSSRTNESKDLEHTTMSSTVESDLPKSHSRVISTEMASVIKEIHRLDAVPSSIPIGLASDYIASKIQFPCQFPPPTDYAKGALWELIDSEFLNVMGADVLERGDLRRGKFGTLGIVEWILDAREHTGWDEICEDMISGKLETLRDKLAEALVQFESVSSHTPTSDLPAHSTTTSVGRESSPTYLKDLHKCHFGNSKSKWMDTVMVSDFSSSDEVQSSSHPSNKFQPDGSPINRLQIDSTAYTSTTRLPAAHPMARSPTPPSDVESDKAQPQAPAPTPNQTISKCQLAEIRKYNTLHTARGATQSTPESQIKPPNTSCATHRQQLLIEGPRYPTDMNQSIASGDVMVSFLRRKILFKHSSHIHFFDRSNNYLIPPFQNLFSTATACQRFSVGTQNRHIPKYIRRKEQHAVS
ncbi:uncharacterized protein MELLADRAFT_60074 [Melampsora larici-populina 98AG31]|uniref:Uncharacterized protein n=1 Tax=Melampsora larici-populina (strain 98AG31 / pathotype 3-4-7) TaxID=747676 RepID=F4R8M9_MELLP|nr:uncharacterized protein MELLADRAFT_60074 [Melampsora larici-populina 98AG31]EGG11049.1 hypothetical protein MELLADRAFT_60074 [Melampsora larici-populina 98AG31]